MEDFQPGDTRFLYALRRAYLRVEQHKQERLREVDLLPAHYAVLINVWAQPGLTGAELARRLGVTPQNTAGLVAKLSGRGLLERVSHATHAHVLELRLTERGSSLLARADALVAEIEDRVLDELGSPVATATADALRRVAKL